MVILKEERIYRGKDGRRFALPILTYLQYITI